MGGLISMAIEYENDACHTPREIKMKSNRARKHMTLLEKVTLKCLLIG
jgi:hypothetical protein